jgi:hypothetical protein
VGLAADGQPGAGGSQWVRVKLFHFFNHFSFFSLFFGFISVFFGLYCGYFGPGWAGFKKKGGHFLSVWGGFFVVFEGVSRCFYVKLWFSLSFLSCGFGVF